FLTAVVFALAFVLLDNQLIGLYVQGEDVIKAGIERLNIIAWSYLICGFMDVTVGVIRGLGYSVMPTIVSLLGVCGIRILWVTTVFGIERFHFVETIYYSYPISWTITFLAHLLCYIYIMHRIKVKNGVS
ncbi:MAG: MATE family efflux transporter, partial [Clostridia bacterium]|nr:MATE family efflux transporter [Clostridia bacterium]